jgi:predicted DNA binding CopG/RHH family protein
MKKALQKFDAQKLADAPKLSTEEAIAFLENFKDLAAAGGKTKKSKLISIKMPEALLDAFKAKAQTQNKAYQSLIKELMWQWLREP